MRRRWLVLPIALLAILTACSSDDERPSATTPSSDASVEMTRPPGPAADLATVLTGGKGTFLGSAVPVTLPEDWVEEERVAAGTATSYRAATLPADGRFDLVPESTAAFRTRIVIRRPADASHFNGTVVVEWLNVSGGLDGATDFALLQSELARQGTAWVGVSAQYIGIEGGPTLVPVPEASGIAGKGLRGLDPDRYGDLHHPGDAFSYDIYSQVARALRAGDGLGGLRPDRLLAVGESQSAAMLVTYANGVQPLAQQSDGFLVHSRGGGAAPLGEAGAGVDATSAFFGAAALIRDDLIVPVLVLEMETDVVMLGGHAARQDDTDRFRLWEVAGAAHADRTVLGPVADSLGCGGPVNDGPQQFAARAALRALDRWVRDGTAPPIAEPLTLDASNALQRDADGIALGGIRTPNVDVPVEVLSGQARPGASIICFLSGATDPMPPERIAARYPARSAYVDEFTRAADAAIGAGFVVPEDRDALLATARPELVAG